MTDDTCQLLMTTCLLQLLLNAEEGGKLASLIHRVDKAKAKPENL
jgi:hypothetical protein